MGRKKIDKMTLEYMVNNLFHKDDLIGFQFTAGNTPLGIKENRPLTMSCSLNFSKSSVVIDCSESEVEDKIATEIFGTKNYLVNNKSIKNFQNQFKKLGYEVEECEFVGYWYWFRVKCKFNEVMEHVNNLKTNLVLEK